MSLHPLYSANSEFLVKKKWKKYLLRSLDRQAVCVDLYSLHKGLCGSIQVIPSDKPISFEVLEVSPLKHMWKDGSPSQVQ